MRLRPFTARLFTTRLCAVALLATAPLLAGCGAGHDEGGAGHDGGGTPYGHRDDARRPGAVQAYVHHAGEWKLVWSDDFRGPAHRRPDPQKWVFDRGGEPQWGNHEWQYYTDRPGNVSLDGAGHLVVTARRERLPGMACVVGPCDITSGRITTKGRFSRAYGRFEARIKVPGGHGMWPAFWMLGANSDKVAWPDNGEIDVMEVLGRQPGTVHGAVHGPGYVSQGIERHTGLPRSRSLADGFHTYRIDWTPDRITWLLDGKVYGSACSGGLKNGQRWVFDHPHYLLLNLAVGGDWPGPPDDSTPFPARMVVDYVRVYAHRH